ncbi:hypothetical protein GL50803_0015081 [Giardia duodenalis]|uniref:Uncharacterized protein n=1 Tax=Giardia intestinalis (strain ATCC 50803 / WB clone C6) TaxID=184922 RepID=A8BQ13_GIAIC|nr:hypothetical protein GL50803_0015081 [Giardia intestinalis]KAE8304087.1 hypothetical protein GL50803_0015081 [Giardia intestinalis]|eukprot:XP_001705565.1 Hypothetical protein GL50803_15081 [Giardia lamblia ATCC 50803]
MICLVLLSLLLRGYHGLSCIKPNATLTFLLQNREIQIETWPPSAGGDESCKSLVGEVTLGVITPGGSFRLTREYNPFSYQSITFNCSAFTIKNSNCTSVLSDQTRSATLELRSSQLDTALIISEPITVIRTVNLDYLNCWNSYQFTHSYNEMEKDYSVCLYVVPNFCLFPKAATRAATATLKIVVNGTATSLQVPPKVNPPIDDTGFTIPYSHTKVHSYCYNCSSITTEADRAKCQAFVVSLLTTTEMQNTFTLSMESIEDTSSVVIPISLSLTSSYMTAAQYRDCFLDAILSIYNDRLSVTLTVDTNNPLCKHPSGYSVGYTLLNIKSAEGDDLFSRGHELDDFDFLPSYLTWFICSNQSCIDTINQLIPLTDTLTSTLSIRMYNQFNELLNAMTVPVTKYVIMCWSAISFYIGTDNIRLEFELTTQGNCEEVEAQISSIPAGQKIPMKVILYRNEYSNVEQRSLTEIATFSRKLTHLNLSEPQIMTCDNWVRKTQGSSCLADLATVRNLIKANRLIAIGFLADSELVASNYYKADRTGINVATGCFVGFALIAGATSASVLFSRFRKNPMPADEELKLQQQRREKRKQQRAEKKRKAKESQII